jgi:O-antigen ligase
VKFSSYFAHPSALVTSSALLYFLNLIFQGKIATVELGAFWAIFTLAWAIGRGDAPFSWHILYAPLLLYGVVSTVSALAAPVRLHVWGEGMLWFKMLIFPCAVILFREVPRMRELAVYAHAAFASYISAWGLGQYILADNRDLEHRISGPSTHVMTFSGMLLPLSLLLLIQWWHERKWWQLVSGSLATITLMLTFTRSVWLGWIVAVFVILGATRVRLAFYALPALLIFVTFMPMSGFSRLVSAFDPQQESNFDRLRMLEAGVEMIKDFPVLGVGPANVKEMYSIYRRHDAPRSRPPHLHNNVVQLWAERGILGLGAYVLLLALFIRECVRAWSGPERMWAEIGIAVAVSLTVAGLFEFNFGDTEVFYLMLNLFALVAVSLERPRQVLNEAPAKIVSPPAEPFAL